MKKYFYQIRRTALCEPSEDFLKVKEGLAYTPSQMYELMEKGIPISMQNTGTFVDGEPNPSWNVPLERERGVDASDVWQAQQEARKRIHTAHISDIRKHGLSPQKDE